MPPAAAFSSVYLILAFSRRRICFAPFVAKPALGRGLGDLLPKSNRPANSNDTVEQPAKLSPGMATLLHGPIDNEPDGAPQPSDTEAKRAWLPYKRLIQVSLVLADLMFLALTVRWLLQNQPLGFGGIALGFLALVLGAWLSSLAFWMEFKE